MWSGMTIGVLEVRQKHVQVRLLGLTFCGIVAHFGLAL
jgi:hypothetical protein